MKRAAAWATALIVLFSCSTGVAGQPADSYGEESWYDAAYYEEFEDPEFDEGIYYSYEDYDEQPSDVLNWFADPPDCVVSGSQVTVNGTQACDVTINGANEFVSKLRSGVDGAYLIFSCFNGHPMYRRQNSPYGEGRLLYFDRFFNEWNLVRSNSVMPEEINPELIGFGGSGDGEERPQFVHTGNWRFNSSLSSTSENVETWRAVELEVDCSNKQGDAVHFKGAVTESKHLSPSQRASRSHSANDNFYKSHNSGVSENDGYPHAHWVRTAVLVLVAVVAVSGVGVLGVTLWRRIRDNAVLTSRASVIEADAIMLTPEQDVRGTYTAPDELTALVP